MARSRFRLALGAAVLGVALLATACGGSSSSSGGTPQAGGVATWAELPGATPNWIFPFIDPAHNAINDTYQFEYLMYRPLYFAGTGDQPTVNYDLSLASQPIYSGNKIVVNLKNYTWSNGEKVTPADVEFFMNMFYAEKANFSQYVTGEIPDNVTSVKTTGPEQVTFTLNNTYSQNWFTGNQLAFITPFPQAWDKTSDAAAAGSGGCTTDQSKCAAVYNYLLNKNKNVSTYATDPIWSVVDGPWKLKSYTTDGAADFVPNKSYNGSVKPKLDQFNEVPFTSPVALYNAELAGNQVNVGEIPANNLPKRNPSDSSLLPPTNPLGKKYTLTNYNVWGWSYAIINYANPTIGPAFQQLYVRQALQSTVDQVTDAAVAWRGYAVPTSGPVPTQPVTQYISANQHANNGQGPNPFNISKAKSLLTSHGWTEQGGVMTCTSPGTGATQCGNGVTAGSKLNLTLEYNSGSTSAGEEVQQWKSDASQAGINLVLNAQPFNTAVNDTTTCPSTPSTCNWQIGYFGYNTFNPVPTGDQFFLPGSAANYSSVSDSKMNTLVNATLHSDSASAFDSYETYATDSLPGAINMADPYKLYAVSSTMGGVTPINPLGVITPENWYFTK